MVCRVMYYDSSLEDLQQEFHTGIVMGIYHKCFHLLLDDGRLITIFGVCEYQMPMAIRTNALGEEPFSNLSLEEGQYVEWKDGIMSIPQAQFTCQFGGRRISLKRSALSKPKHIVEFQTALLRWGKRNGEGRFLKVWCMHLMQNVGLPAEMKLLYQISMLMEAVQQGADAIWNVLMRTVGMGIGLTPSADDIICGLACAAWFYWPEKEKNTLLQTLSRFCVDEGPSRTTRVSCQQMMLTAQGILSDPIFCVAQTISSEDGSQIDSLISEIVRYGSSSGTELCMGFLAGLYMAIGYSESERESQW